MDPARKVAESIWPGVAIVPTMMPATRTANISVRLACRPMDCRACFRTRKDHIHGLNERIRVKSLMDGRRFLYEVVKIYANSKDQVSN